MSLPGCAPGFVASFWIQMSRPRNCTGLKYFPKKRKKPVCTVLNDRLCIPPEHPSNFHLGNPNRKNRVEGKRIEKSWIFQIIVRRVVNFAFVKWEPDITRYHWMTPNGKPSPKLKIPCANNTCGFDPHHQHKKEASRFCRDVSFLYAVHPACAGSSVPPYSSLAGSVFCRPYL